ncbi:hypothetical protein CYMTET_3073 [Cymbomonas tetramitiformis]|uniref:Uncharacterized protein n=1 Tax=Cymbomonas tetramitiformis TaxID=36881 RepID=A0AAE0H4G0_9CHLO|nr:hypothetical protein CYMTET_3073 [Cymbomonas tetramitiformis]
MVSTRSTVYHCVDASKASLYLHVDVNVLLLLLLSPNIEFDVTKTLTSDYFDNAAARHAITSATTPVTPGVPVANSTAAVFVATVRTLTRERFDESVTKHVIKKCVKEEHERFNGDEVHSSVLFAKPVPAIQEAFEAEDPLVAPLFTLDDATASVRSEANTLLFSTIELIVSPTSPAADWLETSANEHPHVGKRVQLEFARRLLDSGGPFQGTSDLLGIRFPPNVDPSAGITDFNTALGSARRKNTPDAEEVKSLFIAALDSAFYAPVVFADCK